MRVTIITNVTVDSLSTLMPTSLSFTSNAILLNDSGLFTTVGAMQILDITTSGGPASIPEPSALALLGAGLVGLFAFRSRRNER
jgi:hypothetical protein